MEAQLEIVNTLYPLAAFWGFYDLIRLFRAIKDQLEFCWVLAQLAQRKSLYPRIKLANI